MRALLCLALASAACARRETPATPPPARWMIARRDVTATDDAGVRLRRGFGVELREARGPIARSSAGHWFRLAELEPATPLPSAPAPLPAAAPRPLEVGVDERWVDVDTAAQRLTVWRGDRPERAFRVSTGVGAAGEPYATPPGTFRIYAKLRSATMASPPPVAGQSDAHPYRFEGVPDVQYFHREIALHGAYWHRRFGERLSHGCVNLAPADAAWLFDVTAPHLGDSERERASDASDAGAPAVGRKLGTLVRVR